MNLKDRVLHDSLLSAVPLPQAYRPRALNATLSSDSFVLHGVTYKVGHDVCKWANPCRSRWSLIACGPWY